MIRARGVEEVRKAFLMEGTVERLVQKPGSKSLTHFGNFKSSVWLEVSNWGGSMQR